MKIEVGNTYLTRDGRKVRILCVDRPDDVYSVVGVRDDGRLMEYTESGKYYAAANESDHDLDCKAPKTVALYVYRDAHGSVYACEYDDGGSLKTVEVEL